MKNGDIQADRVFPITEELQEELERREQRRHANDQSHKNDWIQTGPLCKLPMPLRIAVHAIFLFWLLGYAIFCTPRKRTKKRL